MPKHHNLAKLLYTPDEATEVLSIGKTRLCELLADGTIISVKVGRSRRIPAESLETYVAKLAAGTA
jgi:excisionase family DNA binding protein